jgi:hypothetical protein
MKLSRSGGPASLRVAALMAACGGVFATAGCINVSAPDKPIVINLNISITQEVVYRLDNKAKTLIQENPGIF